VCWVPLRPSRGAELDGIRRSIAAAWSRRPPPMPPWSAGDAPGAAPFRPVWASEVKWLDTGIGVLQREVYPRLQERGIALTVPPRPDNRALSAVTAFGRVVGRSHAAALLCTTPAPAVVRVPSVTFVYDLRWRRTRGRMARLYRYLDLRRAVARTDQIFAISGTTRDALVALFPQAAPKCVVLHLGPGMVRRGDFRAGEPGTVLLSGRAGHKRNELVAQALALARPSWAERFLCVGVSETAVATLVDAFGEDSSERFEQIDDDSMRDVFRRAAVYVTASMDEGFGLPMVEALSAGCQVVAIRQPLTEEILGDAGVLVEDGDAEHLAKQLESPEWIPADVRRARAASFSWDAVADTVAAALRRLDGTRG
jgi:glycosyltransferase involved in cell wall biosynthesis